MTPGEKCKELETKLTKVAQISGVSPLTLRNWTSVKAMAKLHYLACGTLQGHPFSVSDIGDSVSRRLDKFGYSGSVDDFCNQVKTPKTTIYGWNKSKPRLVHYLIQGAIYGKKYQY